MSEPIAGNQNDIYDIEVQFEIVTATLEAAEIPVEGLFLNADAGFDTKEFRRVCEKKRSMRMYVKTSATVMRTGMITSTSNFTMRDIRLNAPIPV